MELPIPLYMYTQRGSRGVLAGAEGTAGTAAAPNQKGDLADQ